jgi:hypothetical protein
LQIGKQFVVSAQVEQNFNNNPNEFFWTLLANPAGDAHSYAYNLQRLVNDFPQSGVLQALLAHASEHKNLRQASVYFNPRSLFKLINAPASFLGVPQERIVVQPGLGVNGSYANDEHPVYEAPAPALTEEPAAGVSEESHAYTSEQLIDTLPLEAMPPLEYEPEATTEIHHEAEVIAAAQHEPEATAELDHEADLTVDIHHEPETTAGAHQESIAEESPLQEENTAQHPAEELVDVPHEAAAAPFSPEAEVPELIKEELIENKDEFAENVAEAAVVEEPEEVALNEHPAREEVEDSRAEYHEEITPPQPEEVSAFESDEPAAIAEEASPVSETAAATVEGVADTAIHEEVSPAIAAEEAPVEGVADIAGNEEVLPETEEVSAEAPENTADHEGEHKANPYFPYESEEAWREEEGIPKGIVPEEMQEEPVTEPVVSDGSELTVHEPETHISEAETAPEEITPEITGHEEPAHEEAVPEISESALHWPEDKAVTEEVSAEPSEPATHWPEDKAATEEPLSEVSEPATHWLEDEAAPIVGEVNETVAHEPDAHFAEIETASEEVTSEPTVHKTPAEEVTVEEPAIIEALIEEEAEPEIRQEIALEKVIEPEPIIPAADEMDETFDEIVGIEDINFNRGGDNFFSFEQEFGAHEEESEQVTAQANAEQQDMSKYHDETMPYSFMWWLDKTRKEHSDTYQPYVKTTTPAVAEKKTKKVVDELQQQYFENIFHITSPIEELEKPAEPAPEEPTLTQVSSPAPAHHEPKRKEHVIIERFIREEPQIRPQSSDKLDNENKAKKSSEDRDELVTETLAIIYSDQMLYHKAISSYKKLMLKFPEKTRYFADKIEQLEKKTQ